MGELQRCAMNAITTSVIAVILHLNAAAAAAGRSESMRMGIPITANKFEFPYLCSVVYHQTWVGACSIITSEVVIVSVSNLNRPIEPGSKKMFYNMLTELTVYAGTIFMNPALYEQRAFAGLQVKKANTLYVAYLYDHLNLIKKIDFSNDRNFNLSTILQRDEVDVKFNVAFLKVAPFEWTNSVRSLPLNLKDLKRINVTTTARMKALENFPYASSNCKIAGWNIPTERMVFHHVLYIPNEMCREAYCNYNLNACLKFPKRADLVCFKSAHWGEPCATDTGAALFCKFFEGGNIFAILTTAINCGQDNLPSVYTTMPKVLEVYERAIGDYVPPKLPAIVL